jgi:hypothetical protein
MLRKKLTARDIAYLPPEIISEMVGRGEIPPPEKSRPNDYAAQDPDHPDEEAGHGEVPPAEIMGVFVKELKRVGYFDRKVEEFLGSLRKRKP